MAILNKQPAIRGMPTIPEQERMSVFEAILAMKGIVAQRKLAEFKEGTLKLMPLTLSAKASTSAIAKWEGIAEDWTRDDPNEHDQLWCWSGQRALHSQYMKSHACCTSAHILNGMCDDQHARNTHETTSSTSAHVLNSWKAAKTFQTSTGRANLVSSWAAHMRPPCCQELLKSEQESRTSLNMCLSGLARSARLVQPQLPLRTL